MYSFSFFVLFDQYLENNLFFIINFVFKHSQYAFFSINLNFYYWPFFNLLIYYFSFTINSICIRFFLRNQIYIAIWFIFLLQSLFAKIKLVFWFKSTVFWFFFQWVQVRIEFIDNIHYFSSLSLCEKKRISKKNINVKSVN